MPDYKLTYFDRSGGRGEAIRIAFHAAGIPLEDNRISLQEFVQNRDEMRFKCVPVLHIDGEEITQSNGMLRFIGKLGNLYPEDAMQAMYCDEAMDAIEDLYHHIVLTLFKQGDELVKAREALASGWLTTIMRGLDELLVRGGGEYFADNRLTVADLKVHNVALTVTSGRLEHVPADLLDKVAPNVAAHTQRISDHEVVKAYYASLES